MNLDERWERIEVESEKEESNYHYKQSIKYV